MNRLSQALSFVLACICLIPLATGGTSALALDQLYWVESGAIQRAGVDGSGVEQLLSADDSHAALSIALDQGNDAMFWAAWIDSYGGNIRRATLQGEEIQDLPASWSEGFGSIAVDPLGDKIYYTDPSDCDGCGSIWRMNQDGSGNERILQQGTPFAIAVYPAGGKVCWGDLEHRWIVCSNPDGSGIQTVVIDTRVQGLAIDPTSAKLYWIDDDAGSIQRVNMDGSDIEELVAGLDDPWGITLDSASGRIYWTDRNAGKIQSARLDGSDLVDILTGLDRPRGIAFLGQSGGVVPAVSTWGVIGLALLLLASSTFVLLRKRS